MDTRRVTQLDVARAAGVHRSSVSMALRNHPNLPATTRDRILQVAHDLGYQADPMLSALAAYRTRTRQHQFRGTLAWVVDNTGGSLRERYPHFTHYHDGASDRAAQHGYTLETFELSRPGYPAARVAGIMRNRGVLGILMCPQPRPEMTVPLPWDQFSAVTFGYSLRQPQLHTVTATHYRAALATMRELLARGYTRIGLALADEHDARTDHNYRAGYLVGLGDLPVLKPLTSDYSDVKALRAWLRSVKPEAVLAGNVEILSALSEIGLSAPRDLGVACPCLVDGKRELSGVVENNRRVGAVAVDTLVSMIQRGERGVPASAERIHVEGYWSEGLSLRPRAA